LNGPLCTRESCKSLHLTGMRYNKGQMYSVRILSLRRRRMNMFFPLLFMMIILFLSGCGATISGTIRPPAVQQAAGAFLAGASKVDVEPPPGYPMGGHSIAGQISRGQWLRLFSRSIFLEDRAGTRTAFVAADLWSIPAGLADRVAGLNSRGPAECTVGRAWLILAATHTHQSPGNLSSSPKHNTFTSPGSGFGRQCYTVAGLRDTGRQGE
jgi:neutral ceramidase